MADQPPDDANDQELDLLFIQIEAYLRADREAQATGLPRPLPPQLPAGTTEAAIQAAILRYNRAEHDRTQKRLLDARGIRALWDGQGSGPLPYGYRRDWHSGDPRGVIVIHKEQATVIRRIFALRQAGNTFAEIAAQLETDGVRTTKQAYFTPASVQAILLHEELYRTGVRHWNGIQAQLRWPIILTDQMELC